MDQENRIIIFSNPLILKMMRVKVRVIHWLILPDSSLSGSEKVEERWQFFSDIQMILICDFVSRHHLMPSLFFKVNEGHSQMTSRCDKSNGIMSSWNVCWVDTFMCMAWDEHHSDASLLIRQQKMCFHLMCCKSFCLLIPLLDDQRAMNVLHHFFFFRKDSWKEMRRHEGVILYIMWPLDLLTRDVRCYPDVLLSFFVTWGPMMGSPLLFLWSSPFPLVTFGLENQWYL